MNIHFDLTTGGIGYDDLLANSTAMAGAARA